MGQLRAIIIDDNKVRRESIRDILPDYIDSVALGFGDGALDYLKPDLEGIFPDVVIMDGDDSKSQGLYTYDWMINKSNDAGIASIPVVILTNDEFSDRCMEFLEIGDVVFYEGEIDETRLFSVIIEAIEEAEFALEPEEPLFEETKSPDRLVGCSVRVPEDDGKQRVVVLDMETKAANLEAALARGRKRASDIRMLLGGAQKIKAQKEDKAFARKSQGDEYAEYNKTIAKKAESVRRPVPVQNDATATPDSIGMLKQKAMSNPFGAFGAQGTIKLDESARQKASSTSVSKKTVVIVDPDLKTRKLCTLFLTQNFNVIALDSGMKTVDYFVKNHADLLIINPVLPGMNGVSTVNSVHMQPGCGNVPVMYLVGDDYMEARAKLLMPGVVGILNKPVRREMIAQSVEGLFGNMP